MKPILFSTPMVQALLNTKPSVWPAQPIDASKPCKSQTRRVMKPQPLFEIGKPGFWHWKDCRWMGRIADHAPYKVGDILYVREAWGCYTKSWFDATCFRYKADYPDGIKEYWYEPEKIHKEELPKWRPSIHMPREAARLFLEVKSVRVERLQDITEADAKAEGSFLDRCECLPRKNDKTVFEMLFSQTQCVKVHGYEFKTLWNSINAKRGYSWKSNPWVWVYEFMRLPECKQAEVKDE